MPIPSPTDGEARQSFIQRCMGDKTMNDEYTDQSQRSAICYTAWRKKHPKDAPPPKEAQDVIFKQYEMKNLGDRSVMIMASDETPDRDNDVIKSDGWILDNFIKNGAILYGHDASKLPVAKPISATVENKQLVIKAQFAKEGTSEFTDAVYSLVQQDILKGVSVGFKGLEKDMNEGKNGRIFRKQELVELSLTPIPSNANARIMAKQYSDEVAKKLLGDEEEEIIKEGLELAEELKCLLLDLHIELGKEDEEEEPEEPAMPPEAEELTEAIREATLKLKQLAKSYEQKAKPQEETQVVEPEPKFSQKEVEFLEKLAKTK